MRRWCPPGGCLVSGEGSPTGGSRCVFPAVPLLLPPPAQWVRCRTGWRGESRKKVTRVIIGTRYRYDARQIQAPDKTMGRGKDLASLHWFIIRFFRGTKAELSSHIDFRHCVQRTSRWAVLGRSLVFKFISIMCPHAVRADTVTYICLGIFVNVDINTQTAGNQYINT